MKTREQIELRDRKELSARQKQLAKPEYKLYLLVLCIMVVLIHIAVQSKETVGTDFEALDAEAEAEWADLIDEAGAAE